MPAPRRKGGATPWRAAHSAVTRGRRGAVCNNGAVLRIPEGTVPAMAATSRGVLTALTVALLALAAFASPLAVGILVFGATAAYGFGWARLMDVPSSAGVFRVVALTALLMGAAVFATGALDLLAFVAAVGVILSFLHQMMRRDGRPRLAETLAADLTGITVAASATGWMLAASGNAGLEVVLTATAVLFSAAAVTLLRAPSSRVALVAGGLAGTVGVLVGLLMPTIGWLAGLLVGVVGGSLVSFSHLLFSTFPASGHRRAAVAAALMPVLSLGVPVHLVTEILGAAR